MNNDEPCPIRIAVLVSGRGRGTNFAALLEGCRSGKIPGSVAVLISTTPETPAMARANAAGVPAVWLPTPVPHLNSGDSGLTGPDPDLGLERLLKDHRIDLICLAGYMRKVGPRLLNSFPNRIMNIHPSLAPAFSGPGMYGPWVHRAVLEYGAKISGCTVQFIDEEYDSGPIIIQRAVPVEEDDTPERLAARILPFEHEAYVEAVRLFALGRLKVDERRVRILPSRE